MPQLRDALTSELVAEGTPEELVLIAQQFPTGEVIYDGVGAEFNPDAVLKARQESLDGMNAALDAPDTPERMKPDIEAAIQEAATREPDAGTIQEVQANIDEARKDLEEAV